MEHTQVSLAPIEDKKIYMPLIEKSQNFLGTEGTVVQVGGNTPWEITNTDDIWIVESGQVQLFVFDAEAGIEHSRRSYFLTVDAGGIVMGMKRINSSYGKTGVLAVAGNNTIVRSLSMNRFEELIEINESPELPNVLDRWLTNIITALFTPTVPRVSYGLTAQEEFEMPAGSCGHALKDLVWVDVLTGQAQYLNRFPIENAESNLPYPICRDGWIITLTDSKIRIKTTKQIAEENLFKAGLELYHNHSLKILDQSIEAKLQQEFKQIHDKALFDQQANVLALDELASILEESYALEAEQISVDPYFAVCKAIGKNQDFPVYPIPDYESHLFNLSGKAKINALAKASKVRTRTINLVGKWWKEEAGGVFAFLKESSAPVALLPINGGGYEIFNPKDGSHIPIDETIAASIHPTAQVFYRPFPNGEITNKSLVRFAISDLKPELIRVLICTVAVGLLSLLTPLITENLFGYAVPNGKTGLLYQLTAFLAGSAVISGMISIAQNIAILRIEGKAGSNLQAALWDRLLNLPATFFRKYNSGELANNALGFDRFRSLIMGSVISTVISFGSSIFSFFLLFTYDLRLALAAFVLTLITVAIVIGNAYTQLKYQRIINKMDSKIMGFVFQLLNGIGKIRISGAEERALDKWAKGFSEQKKITKKALMTNAILDTFNSTWSVLTTAIIFWFVASTLHGNTQISPGQFLGFSTAFGQFMGAMLGVAGIVSSLAQAGPVYEQIKPILVAEPENTANKKDPGPLTGKIEISHVKFRYAPELPLILNDVSVQIEPGEFVALVGPSGTGKSSLFRLLLGFDKPEAGTIYFDNQDINALDIQSIRKQTGTVIQNAKLFPGDIFMNIVGSQPYTIDEAWEAARMAGFDEDVKNMPMGMHTYISEGGGSLSGGQTQRLLIARALIGRPKILLFDEATSALDNKTQSIVTQSVEQLHSTRIVIAHRLSTIEKADRIIVLAHGDFVQQGTYSELLNQPGMFQELAKRQLA